VKYCNFLTGNKSSASGTSQEEESSSVQKKRKLKAASQPSATERASPLWKEAVRGISVVAGADDLEKLEDLEFVIIADDDLFPLPLPNVVLQEGDPNVVLQEGESESFNRE
jgi:hypothetical protein